MAATALAHPAALRCLSPDQSCYSSRAATIWTAQRALGESDKQAMHCKADLMCKSGEWDVISWPSCATMGAAAVPMCLLLLPCQGRLDHRPSLCALASRRAQASLFVTELVDRKQHQGIHCQLPVADAVPMVPDSDGITSIFVCRSWREDERRLASTERRRRRLSGRKTRFCPHADKICLCTGQCPTHHLSLSQIPVTCLRGHSRYLSVEGHTI